MDERGSARDRISCGRARAGLSHPIARLASEASTKAERARHRWQAARLMGDAEAARRHRRSMLRHQAIAWHLDPLRAGNRDAP